MRKNNVLDFLCREARINPVTEVLPKSVQDLKSHTAELKLTGLLAQFSDYRTSELNAAVLYIVY